MGPTMQITLRSDDWDAEMQLNVPCKYEVCTRCEGKGTHVNPSIDGHGLTRDDFADDPDFAEDYFNGVYDVKCYQCCGTRVEPHPDGTHRKLSVRLAIRLWEKQQEQRAQWDREDAAIRRMESGGYY